MLEVSYVKFAYLSTIKYTSPIIGAYDSKATIQAEVGSGDQFGRP